MSKPAVKKTKQTESKCHKRLGGIVVSKAGDKTTVVKVVTISRHPKYLKKMVKTKKYLVHDLEGKQLGEQVVIEETRPLSKRKRWKMVTGAKGSKS